MPADLKDVIEIWKKVVDVQQHFNDLCLRIRNYALTLFTAILAGIGLVEKEKLHFSFLGIDLPTSTILCFLGVVVMWGFYYMDKYWYHRLLVGAVNQGKLIENKYKAQLEELGLTEAIGNASPHKRIFSFKKKADRKDVHSKDKFRVFYYPLLISLLVLGVATFFCSSATAESSNKANESIRSINQIDSVFEFNNDKKLIKVVDTIIKQSKIHSYYKDSIIGE